MDKNPYYLYGDREIVIPFHLSAGEMYIQRLYNNKDKVALINGATNAEVTFGVLLQQSMNFAVYLSQLGVRKGHTVAICSENRLDFFPPVIGVWCTGATITPISDGYLKDELRHTLSITKPKTLIVSSAAYNRSKDIFKAARFNQIIVLSDERPAEGVWFQDIMAKMNVKYEDFHPVEVKAQTDVAAIMYSSGTTGLPKGVMISHYNLIVTMHQIRVPEGEVPTGLNISPWFHAMGFYGLLGSLSIGRTLVYLPKFDEKLYLECIQKFKPVILTMPPPVAVLLSKSPLVDQYDMSSVMVIYCGAAPLDAQTIEEVKRRIPSIMFVMQGYGMTETTLAVSRDDFTSPCGPRPSSVGVASAGNIVKVVDLETGKPVGPHQRGEICIKGATVMLGYVGIKNDGLFDAEGFFRTGDIGYYDDDKYLYIVDRLKELIKYKGYQVPPAELEAILLGHPAIKDCGVVGKPDKMAGELPTAFVVLQPGATASAKEIMDFVANKVSSSKRLRGGVIFIDAIPKNPSGKILRKDLRKMLKTHKSKL